MLRSGCETFSKTYHERSETVVSRRWVSALHAQRLVYSSCVRWRPKQLNFSSQAIATAERQRSEHHDSKLQRTHRSILNHSSVSKLCSDSTGFRRRLVTASLPRERAKRSFSSLIRRIQGTAIAAQSQVHTPHACNHGSSCSWHAGTTRSGRQEVCLSGVSTFDRDGFTIAMRDRGIQKPRGSPSINEKHNRDL